MQWRLGELYAIAVTAKNIDANRSYRFLRVNMAYLLLSEFTALH